MFRTDVSDAVAALPTPPIAATPGYFSDGDPAGGVPGTVVDAAFMNMVQEELIALLTAAGIAPSKTTYTQVRDSIQALIAQAGGFYATDGGSANAMTATLSPAPANYAALTGKSVRIKKGASVNTGAATLNLNGLGATNIFFQGAAVLAGMLRGTEIFEVVYDGTQFELVDPAVIPDKFAADSGATNAMVAALAISPGALTTGLLVAIGAANSNSGATTLNLNALGVKNVKIGASALAGGEIVSGRTYWLEYDGTQFQLLNPSTSTSGFVTTARTISAGGIATGGGDLSANRTITVTKASAADVAAGTDDTRAVTSLALATAFAASAGAPGYIKLPNGILVQWGFTTVPDDSSATATFPLAFPTSCDIFLGSSVSTSQPGNSVDGGAAVGSAPSTTAGAVYNCFSGTPSTIIGVNWIAIGH